MLRAATWLALLSVLSACGGGSRPAVGGVDPATPASGCNGSCADTATSLTVSDVEGVIARAVAEAQARNVNATIAVVDRVGNVLAVFRMNGAATDATVRSPGTAIDGGLEGVDIVPDTTVAIAKAITGAYLSTEGNAFSSRTASQIVQDHFNPQDPLQPGGPLFGVQFSQLPCSDLLDRYSGAVAVGPQRSPLGLSADPGGFPLYKSGTPVGGVGVVSDALYSFDRNISDIDSDDDELIAVAAMSSLAAPAERRANVIAVDGRSLRFADGGEAQLQSDPAAAPSFASIDNIAGVLVAVPGYVTASISAGTAYSQPSSGIRADTLDFPGLDAFVLVDALNVERFPPQAGTDGAQALTAAEVQQVLASALQLANRSRAQIRQPAGSPARVSISVVDTNGVLLGLVRSRDAPVFGIDVSLQKARTAAFLSSAAAAAALIGVPDATYLDGGLVVLRKESLSQYVSDVRNFLGIPTALADAAIAYSDRAGGNLSRPYFPGWRQHQSARTVQQAGRRVESVLHRPATRPRVQRHRSARRFRAGTCSRCTAELHRRRRFRQWIRTFRRDCSNGERHADISRQRADLSRFHTDRRHRRLRRWRGPGRHDRLPGFAQRRTTIGHHQQCANFDACRHTCTAGHTSALRELPSNSLPRQRPTECLRR